MKRILISTILIGALSTWSTAQKPQTAVGVVRPSTSVEINRPTTQTSVTHAQTTVSVTRPQTVLNVTEPTTNVDVIHPTTTVEVIHPQTPEFSAAQVGANAGPNGGKKTATSAQASTSMSGFKPKQAKDFTVAQKAAPVGGGENKLGNDTNAAEKDAANKASLLSKQSNQNIDVNPKLSNLGSLGKAVEQKVEEKKK